MMYKIEQQLPNGEWVETAYILNSLNDAITWFRAICLENPHDVFRLTAVKQAASHATD